VAAFSCRPKLLVDEFAFAVSVADWVVLTAATLAVNEAVEAPKGTVTLPGTVTEVELLARVTPWPAPSAAELSDTVQDVVPDPVNELVPHDSVLTVGAIVEVDPLNWIDVVCEAEPWVALSVTVWDEVTDSTVAVNVWLDAPEGTVTDAGTVMELLLLVR
jgi:hypothetical protein